MGEDSGELGEDMGVWGEGLQSCPGVMCLGVKEGREMGWGVVGGGYDDDKM